MPADSSDITIRRLSADDAGSVAHLSEQLGYPADVGIMRERIREIAGLSDHAVFVACRGADVIAWVHAQEVLHLQNDKRVEIGGLVVDAAHRGAGIGAALVAQCERWARDRGLLDVIVRSQIKREAAHRFYRREGYAQTKTSVVFAKRL